MFIKALAPNRSIPRRNSYFSQMSYKTQAQVGGKGCFGDLTGDSDSTSYTGHTQYFIELLCQLT